MKTSRWLLLLSVICAALPFVVVAQSTNDGAAKPGDTQPPPTANEPPTRTSLRLIAEGKYEAAYEKAKLAFAQSRQSNDKAQQARAAQVLAALRRINHKASEAAGFVAFGDPAYASAPSSAGDKARQSPIQLPWTRTEVNEIAALFAASEQRVYLGAEAAEKSATTETLGRARYIHFAAHGLIDERHPARSGIALSADDDAAADGVLQMREVMRLRLQADLVTLSACRTGLGRLLNGEGLVGLTRAFLSAGADSVVVSLWGVNDVGTAALMKSFYEHLRQGRPKDEALRRAKLVLVKGPQRAWRHPYFWASFVLVGEPR